MEKKNLRTELIIIFWLFIIGSILGHIFEMIIVLFQKGHFETRQGLIYGLLYLFLDIFLDKHYPDEYMNKIFSNKREV